MKKTPKAPKKPADSTRLTALETRQADLEKRIAELERAATRQMPAPWTAPVGPYPSAPPLLPAPQDDIDDARCHVCNGRYKDMTNYVCSHPRCPTRITYGSIGDSIHPSFICGGSTDSASTTAVALATPKNGSEPYAALGTFFDKNTIAGHSTPLRNIPTS